MCCCRCWTDPTTKDAYRLAITGVIITMVACITGFVIFARTESSLSLVYALENLVDFFTDLIVLWRFFAPSSLDEAVERKLQSREERAGVAITYILLALGIFILIRGSVSFHSGKLEGIVDDLQKYESVVVLAFISIILFFGLTAVKFRFAKALESDSLYKDGICSLIGTFLSAALYLNAILVQSNPTLWWIDPVVALFCGTFAILYAISNLKYAKTVQKIPIFSLKWFTTDPDHPTPSITMSDANGIPDDKNIDLEMT